MQSIPTSIVVISQIIKECLYSFNEHSNGLFYDPNSVFQYNEDDIRFVSDIIFDLCNLKKHPESFINSSEKDLFSVWVTCTSFYLNTCRYCFTYHKQYQNIVRSRDVNAFKKCWELGIQNFIEYLGKYDREESWSLTENEKQTINSMVMIEYHAVNLAIEKSINDYGNLNNKPFFENSFNGFSLSQNSLTIYALAYAEVCSIKPNYYNYHRMSMIPNRIKYLEPQISLNGHQIEYNIVCVDFLTLLYRATIYYLQTDNTPPIEDSLVKVYQAFRVKYPIEMKLARSYLRG